MNKDKSMIHCLDNLIDLKMIELLGKAIERYKENGYDVPIYYQNYAMRTGKPTDLSVG